MIFSSTYGIFTQVDLPYVLFLEHGGPGGLRTAHWRTCHSIAALRNGKSDLNTRTKAQGERQERQHRWGIGVSSLS